MTVELEHGAAVLGVEWSAAEGVRVVFIPEGTDEKSVVRPVGHRVPLVVAADGRF